MCPIRTLFSSNSPFLRQKPVGEQYHRFEFMSNATHHSPLKEYPAVFKNVKPRNGDIFSFA